PGDVAGDAGGEGGGEVVIDDDHHALGVVVVAPRVEVVGSDHPDPVVDHQRLGMQADPHARASQGYRLVGGPRGEAGRPILGGQRPAVDGPAHHAPVL